MSKRQRSSPYGDGAKGANDASVADDKSNESTIRIQGGKGCPPMQIALWKSETLTDVTVQVECGERFKAHKLVLASGSGYFRGLLTSGMNDARDRLDLSDTSAECFAPVARWLYEGVCTVPKESMLPNLLEIASFLQIPGLVKATAHELEKRVTFDNVVEVWNLGDVFYVPSLVEAARRLLLAKFESFAASDSFLLFNPERLGAIIADDDLNATETVVYESVVRFLAKSKRLGSANAIYDDTARMLFGHVRLGLLPLEFVENRVETESLLRNNSWGGWVVSRAFRDIVYCKDTAVARKRRLQGSPLEWSELRVGMRVRMLADHSAVLAMFETGKRAPGATKPIGLGVLKDHLAPLLGKTYVVNELKDEKRGILILDRAVQWMLPYTAFVHEVDDHNFRTRISQQ